MEYEPFHDPFIRKPWIDRFQAIFEILLLSGLVSSFLASLPLSAFYRKSAGLLLKDAKFMSIFLILEAGIPFLLLAIVLKVRRETVQSLGWRWNQWKSQLIAGLVIVPFLF